VAEQGRVKTKININFEIRVWALCAHTVLFFGFGVRIVHTAFASLFFIPLCAASKNRKQAEV
jgi:predicted membrane protein